MRQAIQAQADMPYIAGRKTLKAERLKLKAEGPWFNPPCMLQPRDCAAICQLVKAA